MWTAKSKFRSSRCRRGRRLSCYCVGLTVQVRCWGRSQLGRRRQHVGLRAAQARRRRRRQHRVSCTVVEDVNLKTHVGRW